MLFILMVNWVTGNDLNQTHICIVDIAMANTPE